MIACIQHQYYIRGYQADDTETIWVNKNLVVSVGVGDDSGHVNVNPYLLNGLNNFTFMVYNGPLYYSWAFELKKNSEIIFNSTDGNHNDTSKESQYVYNNTISLNVTRCY